VTSEELPTVSERAAGERATPAVTAVAPPAHSPSVLGEERIAIRCDADILAARARASAIGVKLGFSSLAQAVVATALSELARNILEHAGHGEIRVGIVQKGARRAISIIAHDHGPGIPDIELAMRDGYSTKGGLGLGLPGTKRLMDEFEITSVVGQGTTATVRKWAK